jgi:hypothetical protein
VIRAGVVRPLDAAGVGVVKLDGRLYLVAAVPCDVGGRGFSASRIGSGFVYHVRVGAETECECLGFLRWGRCKHTTALESLMRRGEL